MTLIEQIQAQKALMESKGAIDLRIHLSQATFDDVKAQLGDEKLGLPFTFDDGMEGFAILATWPETQ